LVRLQGVRKAYGGVVALDGVDLEVHRGEFFSLLGPSGCGKTTLLRLLAGFETPDAGRIEIGGKDMAGVPPYRRPVNTVFQNYALFPHMTVEANVAFGLRMKGLPQEAVRRKVAWVLELVDLLGLEKRYPRELSGGQKQRVALARALVLEPEVLLLDEPLSALDLKLRQELRVELMQLQRRLGTTFIFVTHDQEEALVMSDRIAVMRAGRIVQVGLPEEVYERPENRFVAEFLGRFNFLPARPHPLGAETPLGPLRLQGPLEGEALLGIRPEKIRLYPVGNGLPARENLVRAVVEEIVYTGAENQYYLRAEGVRLLVELTALVVKGAKLHFQVGQSTLQSGDLLSELGLFLSQTCDFAKDFVHPRLFLRQLLLDSRQFRLRALKVGHQLLDACWRVGVRVLPLLQNPQMADCRLKLTEFFAAILDGLDCLAHFFAPHGQDGLQFLQLVPVRQKAFGIAQLEKRQNRSDSG
jgi:spermidine/putrescine transport system ATP-binding protein